MTDCTCTTREYIHGLEVDASDCDLHRAPEDDPDSYLEHLRDDELGVSR